MNSNKKLDLVWGISLILCGTSVWISDMLGIPKWCRIAYAVILLIVLVYTTVKKIKSERTEKVKDKDKNDKKIQSKYMIALTIMILVIGIYDLAIFICNITGVVLPDAFHLAGSIAMLAVVVAIVIVSMKMYIDSMK